MMIDKSSGLSDTARALLTAAALRNDHLIVLPKLPVGGSSASCPVTAECRFRRGGAGAS
jgi:hypothetical protein